MNKGWHFPLEFLDLKNSQPLGVGTASCVSGLGFSGHLPAGDRCPKRTPPALPPFEQRVQSASTRQLLSGLLQTLPSSTGKPRTRPLQTLGDSLGLSVRPHPRRDTIQLPGCFPPPSDGGVRSCILCSRPSTLSPHLALSPSSVPGHCRPSLSSSAACH